MIMIPLVIQTIEDDDDRAFIEAIYIKYVKLMYITARTYCGALVNVNDVVSESVVSLISQITKLRGQEEKAQCSYIITTVRNKAFDAYRKSRRENAVLQIEDRTVLEKVCCQESVEEKVIFWEKYNTVIGTISELPWLEKEVLRMHCQMGMPVKSIAEEMNILEADVWKALRHARKTVRDAI